MSCFNTLRQDGRHFPDDIFKCIFLNENVWISIRISLKFVPKGPINNISALVQIMAWRRPGDKPLSEPMIVSVLTHICVTRPQWVLITVYLLAYLMATIPTLSDLNRIKHRGINWNCQMCDDLAFKNLKTYFSIKWLSRVASSRDILWPYRNMMCIIEFCLLRNIIRTD